MANPNLDAYTESWRNVVEQAREATAKCEAFVAKFQAAFGTF